jgi:hypothetical protein
MHLLNRCKTDSLQLYHEGLGNFVGESGGHTDPRMPSAPLRAALRRCWCRRRSSPRRCTKRSTTWLPTRSPPTTRTQPVVLEVLAAAMAQAEGAPAIVKREQAQQWLRQHKYQPGVLHIGLASAWVRACSWPTPPPPTIRPANASPATIRW